MTDAINPHQLATALAERVTRSSHTTSTTEKASLRSTAAPNPGTSDSFAAARFGELRRIREDLHVKLTAHMAAAGYPPAPAGLDTSAGGFGSSAPRYFVPAPASADRPDDTERSAPDFRLWVERNSFLEASLFFNNDYCHHVFRRHTAAVAALPECGLPAARPQSPHSGRVRLMRRRRDVLAVLVVAAPQRFVASAAPGADAESAAMAAVLGRKTRELLQPLAGAMARLKVSQRRQLADAVDTAARDAHRLAVLRANRWRGMLAPLAYVSALEAALERAREPVACFVSPQNFAALSNNWYRAGRQENRLLAAMGPQKSGREQAAREGGECPAAALQHGDGREENARTARREQNSAPSEQQVAGKVETCHELVAEAADAGAVGTVVHKRAKVEDCSFPVELSRELAMARERQKEAKDELERCKAQAAEAESRNVKLEAAVEEERRKRKLEEDNCRRAVAEARDERSKRARLEEQNADLAARLREKTATKKLVEESLGKQRDRTDKLRLALQSVTKTLGNVREVDLSHEK